MKQQDNTFLENNFLDILFTQEIKSLDEVELLLDATI